MTTQIWAAPDAYHRYVGRWSQQVARHAVDGGSRRHALAEADVDRAVAAVLEAVGP